MQKQFVFFAKLLPEHKEENIYYLEEKIENLENISHKLIDENNLINIFKFIDQNSKVLEIDEIKFECSCSYEKDLESVKLLGDEQLNEILINNGEIEIACYFCCKKYHIRVSDLKSLLKE